MTSDLDFWLAGSFRQYLGSSLKVKVTGQSSRSPDESNFLSVMDARYDVTRF